MRVLLRLAVVCGALLIGVSRPAHAQFVCTVTGNDFTVTPCNGTASKQENKTDSVLVTVTNNTYTYDSYNLTPSCTGVVTSCTSVPSVYVPAYQATSFYLKYTTGASAGSAPLYITVKSIYTLKQIKAGVTVTVTAPPSDSLTISAPYIDTTYQNVSACSASCFAVTYSHSTPAYFTLDQPRNATLVYNSDRQFPRPIIAIRTSPDWHTGYLAKYWLQVSLDSTGALLPFTNGETKLIFTASPSMDPQRLVGQLDMSTYNTGMYRVTVTVTAIYPNSVQVVRTLHIPIMVLNDQLSYIASGWNVAGLQHLTFISGGHYLVSDGSGGGTYYPALNTPAVDFTTLSLNLADSSYSRSYPDGSTVKFSKIGLMLSSADRAGHTTTIQYDASNRIRLIYEPMRSAANGGTYPPYLTFSYGTYGLASILEAGTVGAARQMTVTVSPTHQLTKIRDHDGYNSFFGYDSYGRLDSVTNRRGAISIFSYDSAWKISQTQLPPIDVDAGNGSTVVTTPILRYRSWQTPSIPLTATASIPAPVMSAFWGDAGYLIDAKNDTTQLLYFDTFGAAFAVTDALYHSAAVSRVGLLPIKIWPDYGDGLAFKSNNYTYSGACLTMSQAIDQAPVYQHCRSDGQVDSIWGGGHRFERRFYGATGLLDSIRYADTTNSVVRYTYDAITKQLASATDALGHVIHYHYDPVFGNLDSTSTVNGGWAATHFDAHGRDSTTLTSATTIHTTLYDFINRPTYRYDGVNPNATLVTYDALFLTSVTDALGQVYRFDHNALGWKTRDYAVNSTTTFTSYRYNPVGNITSWTNKRLQRVDMTYDAIGRLVSKQGANTTTSQIQYLNHWRNNDPWPDAYLTIGSNSTEIDTLYRHVSRSDLTNGADTVKVALGGQRFKRYTVSHPILGGRDSTFMSSTSGVVFPTRSIGLDTLTGAFTNLSITGLESITFKVNGDGLRTATTWSIGGVTQQESYTNGNRVYDMSFGTSGLDTAFRRAYRYDSEGRIAVEERAKGVGASIQRKFLYDTLGQLHGVDTRTQSCQVWPSTGADSLSVDFGWRYTCGGIIDSVRYTYDAVGNRTELSQTYSAGNKLNTSGQLTYEYDADGNVTRKYNSGTNEDRRFYWNSENLLDSIVVVSGSTTGRIGYRYNAFGQLVARLTNGVIDRYYLIDDQSQRLAELDAAFHRIAEYVYYPGVDQPSVLLQGSTTVTSVRNIQQDRLGNITGHTDGTNPTQSVGYSPWGIPTITGSTDNSALWKGLPYETGLAGGLYYMRDRWYDPDIGRFVSEDPAGIASGVNLYKFGGNDPINHRDPFGHDWECVDMGYWNDGYVDGEYAGSSWVSNWQCFDTGSDGEDPPGTPPPGWPPPPPPHGPTPPSTPPPPPPPPPVPRVDVAACIGASLNLAVTVAGDVSGLEAIAQGTKFATAAARLSVDYVELVLSRDAQQVTGQGLSKTAFSRLAPPVINSLGGAVVATSVEAAKVSSGWGNTFDLGAATGDLSVWDFVPVVASVRAGLNMKKACTPK